MNPVFAVDWTRATDWQAPLHFATVAPHAVLVVFFFKKLRTNNMIRKQKYNPKMKKQNQHNFDGFYLSNQKIYLSTVLCVQIQWPNYNQMTIMITILLIIMMTDDDKVMSEWTLHIMNTTNMDYTVAVEQWMTWFVVQGLHR